MGRSILVASGKGGAGRTTFAIAMSIGLARKGYKVCLFDMNFGLRNDDIYMGLEDRILFDVGDIMAGVCKVEKALIKDHRYENLYLLEATQNKIIKGITEGHIRALINQLKKDFDYIVIDAPSAIDANLNIAAAGADSAVLVMTPDPLALRNGDTVDRRLENCGVKSRCFVLNKVKHGLSNDDYGPSIDDFTRVFSIPMAGLIPYDENIQLGNNAGRPVWFEDGSYLAKNIDDIITRMLG